MADSDRPETRTWPEIERRQTERRSAVGRRVAMRFADPVPAPALRTDRRVGDRRRGVERRDDSQWEPISLEATLTLASEPAAQLIAAATVARRFARARYSQFKVGAALETADGTVVTGCNIENATYGLTLCAERVALVKALSDGHDVFTRVVVVADTDALTPPCGPCRQLLWEYCGDIEVVLANLKGETAGYRLSALLPLPFDARLLG